MNKFIGLGATIFLLGASFFPLSWLFIASIIVVCLLISFYALKYRLHLIPIEKETFRLFFSKIVAELFVIAPLVISIFLFIDVDYRWAFVVIGILMIVLQLMKLGYYLYARKNISDF